ncbi:cytochrome-c peroxidase [Yoonia sp. R2331]|uniref:cytochrome-c peroxidase n=1 Tax=Yoonia sp. R2331 TaxID=3237238 RepID=UPI0034E5CE32
MRKTAIGIMVFLAQPALANPVPEPVTDAAYAPINMDEALLGQLLFYDPILSGNQEVACATCHHPKHGTADGLSLGLGDGGIGLGPDRIADPDNMPEQRIPRNAPGLFNLGAHEFTVLFHDGRIAVDPTKPGGLRTPLDADMAEGFASLLSAQTMFPVLSPDEMAGHYTENDVSTAVRQGVITGPGGAWDIIARRVAGIPEYAADFIEVYPDVTTPDDIAFTHISDAIAMFMTVEWRSDTSPFDAALRGERALPEAAQRGQDLFYGSAGCADCHSGPFQTDHQFHAMAVPQIGPGKAARFETHARDEGRFRVTGNPADLYAFRTPSLRNVSVTGPYGHAGAHATLQGFLRDHVDPVAALQNYDPAQAILPELSVEDTQIMDQPLEIEAISDAAESYAVALSEEEIMALVAFLDALTDPAAITGRLGIPESVPSGLKIDR